MNSTDSKEKINKALYYMQNDTLKAIEIFDEILEKEPENIDALNGKGSTLMKLNLIDEAEKYFDRSISIKKTSSALINKGIINKNKKEYQKSLNYFDEAIQLNPQLTTIITLLKNEVISLLDEEVKFDLDNFQPEIIELIEEGIEYKNSKRLWDALECYKKAILLDKSCINYVQILIKEIKIILFHELKIKTPKFENTQIDQLKIKSLRLLLVEENPEQSLKIINEILKKDSDEIDTINEKGCVLFLFDKYEKSIKCFDKCLKLDADYCYALFNKALVLRMINKLEESLKCFDELLKIKNDSSIKAYQLEILDKLHQRS